jgi:hypothetical protein
MIDCLGGHLAGITTYKDLVSILGRVTFVEENIINLVGKNFWDVNW